MGEMRVVVVCSRRKRVVGRELEYVVVVVEWWVKLVVVRSRSCRAEGSIQF